MYFFWDCELTVIYCLSIYCRTSHFPCHTPYCFRGCGTVLLEYDSSTPHSVIIIIISWRSPECSSKPNLLVL